ncbi:MAG: hypothetical protein INR69_23185, partial [Mucilaginibacter polytrichastri]|nr:hypothetical protein [Mucilaginibacter polytrichastri]
MAEIILTEQIAYNIRNGFTGEDLPFRRIAALPDGATVDNLIWISNNGDLIENSKSVIDARWFGVGSPNRTASQQAAGIKRACEIGLILNREVHLPPGVFEMGNTVITLAGSFTSINVRGAGRRLTTLRWSGGAGRIRIMGGSGAMTSGSWTDMRLEGIDISWLVEIVGKCGYKVKRCSFGRSRYGGVFTNPAGTEEFTEFSQFIDCDFDGGEYQKDNNGNYVLDGNGQRIKASYPCQTPIFYNKEGGSGHNSFHGSTPVDCKINMNMFANTPVIEIGPGANPYNCNIGSNQIWCPNAPELGSRTIIQNNSTLSPSFTGIPTYEGFEQPTPVNNYENATVFMRGHRGFLIGAITGYTWYKLGSLVQTDGLNITGSSTGNKLRYNRKPFTIALDLTTGNNDTGVFAGDLDESILARLTAS